MKIQIISKIAKNHSGIKQIKETSIAKRNRLSLQTDQNVQDQYYPRKQIKKERQHPGIAQEAQGRLFFQQFQKKCAVIYQKVNRDPPKVQRQLEPILAAMINHHRESTQVSEYEFSFKKKQSTTSTIPTQQNQSPRQSQQYFFNRGHRSKLRKFNSLMTLRAEQTHRVELQPSFQGQKIVLRKNCSLMKCDQGSYLGQGNKQNGSLANNTRKSLNSQYCYEGEATRQNQEKIQSGRDFAQQKDRLARIRRELNEVYQMRKPQRLKLF